MDIIPHSIKSNVLSSTLQQLKFNEMFINVTKQITWIDKPSILQNHKRLAISQNTLCVLKGT